MSRDPFKPPARHAKPRHTRRRAVIGATLAVAAAGTLTIAGHAHAATSGFGATVAHAATIAAQRFTPSPAPITLTTPRTGYTRADRRVCRDLRAFDAAGIPGPAILARLAADGMQATRAFRVADGMLGLAVLGERSFEAEDTAFQRLCGQD